MQAGPCEKLPADCVAWQVCHGNHDHLSSPLPKQFNSIFFISVRTVAYRLNRRIHHHRFPGIGFGGLTTALQYKIKYTYMYIDNHTVQDTKNNKSIQILCEVDLLCHMFKEITSLKSRFKGR